MATSCFDKINKLVSVYKKRFHLSNWTIWVREESGLGTDATNYVMHVTPSWEYMEATITINGDRCRSINDIAIFRKLVIHEMMHIIVAQMSTKRTKVKAEEKVVTMLQQIITDIEAK